MTNIATAEKHYNGYATITMEWMGDPSTPASDIFDLVRDLAKENRLRVNFMRAKKGVVTIDGLAREADRFVRVLNDSVAAVQ